MQKINNLESITYSGGLIGILFGSTKGKMQTTITAVFS